MVGGTLIEVSEIEPGVTRLWCIGTGCEQWDELAVNVATELKMPAPGDQIWWQGRIVFWDQDRRRLRRIGYSYDPRKEPTTKGGADA